MRTHSPRSNCPVRSSRLFLGVRLVLLASVSLVTACDVINVPDDPDTGGENQPPVFASAGGGLSAVEGKPFALTVSAADPEGQTVSYRLVDPPVGATISAAGVIAWTPASDAIAYADDPATTLVVEAADEFDPPATSELVIALQLLNDEDGDGAEDAVDDDDDNDTLKDSDELELGTNPGKADTDDDTVRDDADNCPVDSNVDQENADDDSVGDVCDDDADNDGIVDETDNCPLIKNADQTNSDTDDAGDACDDDDDNDQVADGPDNCPNDPNTDQLDTDSDNLGNVCDPDDDNDKTLDADDNCPLDYQDDQLNTDNDGLGDVCDPNDDNDGFDDDEDNCPKVAQDNQSDLDKDGLGDLCDPCKNDESNVDPDNDGFCGLEDNCPDVSNEDQVDTDEDGEGDTCDLDDDGDTVPDTADNCTLVENLDQADCDSDDIGNVCDPDQDNDLILDADGDNCPCVANFDQTNTDGDAEGDECDDNDDNDLELDVDDNCPTVANDDQLDTDKDTDGDACDTDDDGDGKADVDDNCPLIENSDQANSDTDGDGDACDDDDDNDNVLDGADNCPLVSNAPKPGEPQADQDLDSIGDACDDDRDGDGIANGLDNCPDVANKATGPSGAAKQLDVDDDGIGAACDSLVEIPGAAFGNGADLNVDGAARAGTVVVTFRGDCAGSQCANPGAFILESLGYASIRESWVSFVGGGGLLQKPFVGVDATAFIAGLADTGKVVFERIYEGALAATVEAIVTELPHFVDGPDGTTFVETFHGTSRKLTAFAGDDSPLPKKSAAAFADSASTGAVLGDDGVLYYPTTSAGKFTLTGFKPDGSSVDLTGGNAAGLRFLEMDSVSGTPWYCVRKFATSSTPLEIKRFEGAVVAESQSFLSAPNCDEISAVRSGTGVWWVTHGEGAQAVVESWDPSTGVTSNVSYGCDPTIYAPASSAFIVGKCQNDKFIFANTLGSFSQSTWLEEAATAFSLQVATHSSGAFVAAYRT
ncbi:MAG: hypothetical protein ACI9OJ_002165, partial [Myxococcota bacterium]